MAWIGETLFYQRSLPYDVVRRPAERPAVFIRVLGSTVNSKVWTGEWSSDLPGPNRRYKVPSDSELDWSAVVHTTEFPGGHHDHLTFHSAAKWMEKGRPHLPIVELRRAG